MVYNTPGAWKVFFVSRKAEKEVEELPDDIRAHFARIVELIQAHGLENVHEPYVKHLSGKLWEMRMKGKDGIARSIYLATTGKRLAVLYSFIKKTQKTPRDAIETARSRAREAGLF